MSKRFWDVIPPEKPQRKDRIKELTEWMEKHKADNKEIMPYRMPFTQIERSPCMHDNCPNCHGTGVGRMGTCVHMISCPCPKCSQTMLMSARATL